MFVLLLFHSFKFLDVRKRKKKMMWTQPVPILLWLWVTLLALPFELWMTGNLGSVRFREIEPLGIREIWILSVFLYRFILLGAIPCYGAYVLYRGFVHSKDRYDVLATVVWTFLVIVSWWFNFFSLLYVSSLVCRPGECIPWMFVLANALQANNLSSGLWVLDVWMHLYP